ncbi:cell envelope integrity protein TolA [Herbaspirillum sp. RTI4]|uniref:cell envelope integrity protein TolA n=1 Tax=Herbaspirillum sp. RTI4 TaxID=3048640 RepID=UPI002AB5B04B|nr:cell envelope integrity protein TolA [Herbaspirillum sp. RTI4]MDY7580001.1 cell envelope integrity protein TolA [Herbaspirillum sp. RTI4]MEA9982815.1 cell envelope integrity protein TolA [Herbaspirillum sp. RTI4]
MDNSSPPTVPHAPGRWRAVALALLVHGALIAFLWIGIRWQNSTPIAVEAEIWNPQIREAAPLPEPEARRPDPVPVARPVPPPPKVEEAPVINPDIALEKEKKRKEQQKRDKELQDEKKEQLRLKQEKQDKQEELDKRKKQEQQQEQKKEKEADEKKKKELDKLAADKQRKQQEQDSKQSDKRRQDDLKRMMSQAGGTGDASRSQGPRGNADYIGKVGARIRSNTVFNVPDSIVGNPSVEYTVELLPDGTLRGLRKTKSSGVSGFDEAVQRAIEKSVPFPPDKDGKVPASFAIVHKPKDQ